MGVDQFGRTTDGRLQGPLPWRRALTPPISATAPPSITGTGTLTAASGAFLPDGWVHKAYRWTQYDSLGGVIASASGPTYVPPVGSPTGTVRVTQTIVQAGRGLEAVSAPVPGSASSNAPIFSNAPVITGPQAVGGTLTASAAIATGEPAPVVTWRWYKDDVLLVGVTGPTLVSSSAGNYQVDCLGANGVLPNAVSAKSARFRVADTLASSPMLAYVGTASGEARSYAQTNWNASNVNGQGNSSYCGSPLAACAYASFAGNTETDAYVVTGIKGGRDNYGGPSLRGGYSGQHDTGYLCAVVWAKLTPRVWAQFDSAWRASLDQFMRWALVAAIGAARDDGVTFRGDMLGNATNATTRGGNPNISSAPSANIGACMDCIGVSAAKAYLDTVVVATEEVAMRSSPWRNIAKSFSLPRVTGAPTHAQIQTNCRRATRFGVALSDQLGMWEAEVIHAFSKTISEGYANGAGIPSSLYAAYPSGAWATGRGRVVPANLAAIRADPEFVAIKGTVGAIREMDSTDAGGLRLSASYSEWTHRLMALYTLIVFTAGTVDPNSARARALRGRIKGGCTHMRLIGKHGFLSAAHIVQGGLPSSPEDNGQWQGGGDVGGWSTSQRAVQWGLSFQHDYGRVIEAIYDM